jgi:FkbM family methyltransferase
MGIGYLLAGLFEKFPEIPLKNKIRYFLAFNKMVPKAISNVIPIRGYELHYHIKPGDVVIDAGAYTGDYTVFAAKKAGREGKVIAFEPDEKNLRVLRRNLAHDKLNNVTIIPRGLWDKNTSLSLDSFNGLHSTISSGGKEKIQVAKLDDEIKKLNLKKIDFIKMDIEGAEIEAVKGAIKILKKFRTRLAIASYHIVNGKQTSIFLEKLLSELGYNVKSDFPMHLTTYAW